MVKQSKGHPYQSHGPHISAGRKPLYIRISVTVRVMMPHTSSALIDRCSRVPPFLYHFLYQFYIGLKAFRKTAGICHPVVHFCININRILAFPSRHIAATPDSLEIRRQLAGAGTCDQQISAESENQLRQISAHFCLLCPLPQFVKGNIPKAVFFKSQTHPAIEPSVILNMSLPHCLIACLCRPSETFHTGFFRILSRKACLTVKIDHNIRGLLQSQIISYLHDMAILLPDHRPAVVFHTVSAFSPQKYMLFSVSAGYFLKRPPVDVKLEFHPRLPFCSKSHHKHLIPGADKKLPFIQSPVQLIGYSGHCLIHVQFSSIIYRPLLRLCAFWLMKKEKPQVTGHLIRPYIFRHSRHSHLAQKLRLLHSSF